MQDDTGRLDLAAVRARLAGARGRQYWRSLEELAEAEGFRAFLQREFPRQAATRYSSRLTWVFIGAGVLWLTILIGLTLGDVLTRDWLPAPGPWSAAARR